MATGDRPEPVCITHALSRSWFALVSAAPQSQISPGRSSTKANGSSTASTKAFKEPAPAAAGPGRNTGFTVKALYDYNAADKDEACLYLRTIWQEDSGNQCGNVLGEFQGERHHRELRTCGRGVDDWYRAAHAYVGHAACKLRRTRQPADGTLQALMIFDTHCSNLYRLRNCQSLNYTP